MGRRKVPRVNFNIIAAVVIILLIAAGFALLEWQPPSDMEKLLKQLQEQLLAENWEDAAATMEDVHSQWVDRRKWLVLDNSRNAVVRFEEQLARVRAGIDIRHRPSAVIDAEHLMAVWREFAD